jgi:hypothetical protein
MGLIGIDFIVKPDAARGTRKIADLPGRCGHPDHEVPNYTCYENGIYEHICPSCGDQTIFTVRNPTS